MVTTDSEKPTRGSVRRKQIIEVATALFNEHGYHETSMEMIAAEVGIRKASLYYHFAGKDDILIEVHREMILLIIDRQEDRIRSDRAFTPPEMLHGMMSDLVELMETHPGHLRVFFEHFRELRDETRSEIADKRDHYRSLLLDVLKDGVASGDFGELDPFLTAMSIFGMCNWTYQWFRAGGPFSAAQVSDYFYDQVLGGIRNGVSLTTR